MSLRIRWSQAGAVILGGALVLLALRVAPSLLRAPEPPPVPADVGLPQLEAAQIKLASPKQAPARTHPKNVPPQRKRTRHTHRQPKHKSKRSVPTAPPAPPPPLEAPEKAASSAPPPVPPPMPEAPSPPAPAPTPAP